MSMKLKISYEHEEELARVLTILNPLIIRCKRSGNQEGRYKKVYVELRANTGKKEKMEFEPRANHGK